MRLLPILAAGCFVSSMSMRLTDPVVPDIARDLSVPVTTAALLASAYSFPYALGQPLLGALGDALGKAKIIKITLAVMALCIAALAVAPTIDVMFAARIIGGAAGGGVIPLAFALVGDRFDIAERQVALSRVLMAIIGGQMAGTLGSGVIASAYGWRVSMVAGTVLAVAALIITLWQLHPRANAERPPLRLSSMMSGYAQVFANPRAAVCFTAVFLEGIIIFGLFPYVAALLEERGSGGLKEAGFVLAGFALGGLAYTALVRLMLSRLGLYNLIRAGGIVSGLGLALLSQSVPWLVELMVFFIIGIGFYMIHNSLQTEATELAPGNRASAVSAHAFFFFLGQAAGPLAYAAGLLNAGAPVTLLVAAAAMALTGLGTAAGLKARMRSKAT
jgi:predicted MFS family arabinose efflux permease